MKKPILFVLAVMMLVFSVWLNNAHSAESFGSCQSCHTVQVEQEPADWSLERWMPSHPRIYDIDLTEPLEFERIQSETRPVTVEVPTEMPDSVSDWVKMIWAFVAAIGAVVVGWFTGKKGSQS